MGPNHRLHWAARHRWNKAWGEEVWGRILSYGYPHLRSLAVPWECAIISITIYATHPPDYDNATASIKPIIDALKGRIIRDDSYKLLAVSVTLQKVKTKKEEHVELVVKKNE